MSDLGPGAGAGSSPSTLSGCLCIVGLESGDLGLLKDALAQAGVEGVVGVEAVVGCDARAVKQASGLVLTGAGSFGAAMEHLRDTGLIQPLMERIEAGVPLLGICSGLHILFESSEEDPGAQGLGVVRGDVRALPDTVDVPHAGWDEVQACTCSDLLDEIPDGSAFYFAHSYAVMPRSPADLLAMTDYEGVTFTSAIEAGNVVGVQFQPENSGVMGLRFLRNFARRAAS